jgi:DNA-binding response OmpR family regulator
VRILLVEDEGDLAAAVAEHIRGQGHAVDGVARLDEAAAALAAVDYDLVLLDLQLPDGQGLDLLRRLRRAGDRRPVIILTARDQVRDRIAGLDAGADDYLVKPFDLAELTARLGAVARRYSGDPSPLRRVGAVALDIARHQATLAGERVELTAREWALLEALLRRPGAIVSKARLEDALYAFGDEVESNAVEAHVSRLRKKLGRDIVVTQRGLGYRLGDEAPA